LITNMKTFLEAVGVSGPLVIVIYVTILAVWVAALAFSIQVNRLEKRDITAAEPSTSRVV